MCIRDRDTYVVTCFLPSTIRILALLYVLSTVLRISSSNLLKMFIAMAYARGWGLFNCWITCAVTKKLRKNIFSLVWNFDNENFSSSHLWYQAKNNPIFTYFPLSSRPSNYSVLKFGRYLMLYIRRSETWQQLVTDWSMCEAGVLGSLWQFLSRRPQISISAVLG